jgi:hypothetical protein
MISKTQSLYRGASLNQPVALLSKHVARRSNWRDPFCLGKFPLSRLEAAALQRPHLSCAITSPARALCAQETLFAGIARRCCLVTGIRIATDSSRASLFERSLHGARTRPPPTIIAFKSLFKRSPEQYLKEKASFCFFLISISIPYRHHG